MRASPPSPRPSGSPPALPSRCARQVDRTVDAATKAQAVAVLVAYNVPGRDCGGYSAGGARDYARWIDGFADGVKDRPAVVIVEPDALASGCVKLGTCGAR